MSHFIKALCGKDEFGVSVTPVSDSARAAVRKVRCGIVRDSRITRSFRRVNDGSLDRFRKKDVMPRRTGSFEDFVKGIKGMFDVKTINEGEYPVMTAKWTSAMDLGALLDLRFEFKDTADGVGSYDVAVTVLSGVGKGEKYEMSFADVNDCWNWFDLHWVGQSTRDAILLEVKDKATGMRSMRAAYLGDSRVRRGVVRDSRVRRGVVRDTAVVRKRVKDSASIEELRRFAKEHAGWELYKGKTSGEEICYDFDAGRYAIISVDSQDNSYEVRLSGFSEKVDEGNVRRYTDLERAAKFAYARGREMVSNDGYRVYPSRMNEKTEDSIRRRVVRDSRRRGVVRDSRVRRGVVRDSRVRKNSSGEAVVAKGRGRVGDASGGYIMDNFIDWCLYESMYPVKKEDPTSYTLRVPCFNDKDEQIGWVSFTAWAPEGMKGDSAPIDSTLLVVEDMDGVVRWEADDVESYGMRITTEMSFIQDYGRFSSLKKVAAHLAKLVKVQLKFK